MSSSYLWVVDRPTAGDGTTSLPNRVGRWDGTTWESVGGTGFTSSDGGPRVRGIYAVSDTEVFMLVLTVEVKIEKNRRLYQGALVRKSEARVTEFNSHDKSVSSQSNQEDETDEMYYVYSTEQVENFR